MSYKTKSKWIGSKAYMGGNLPKQKLSKAGRAKLRIAIEAARRPITDKQVKEG